MNCYACRLAKVRQCHRVGIGFIFKSTSSSSSSSSSLNKYLRIKGDHNTEQFREDNLVILKILINRKYVDKDQTAAGGAVRSGPTRFLIVMHLNFLISAP